MKRLVVLFYFIVVALPVIHSAERLQQHVEKLMTGGGDDRTLYLSGKNTNKYNTSAQPWSGISFSSSTSCNPSQTGFDAAVRLYKKMQQADQASWQTVFGGIMREIRNQMKLFWGDCAIMLTPSGTDAEFWPVVAALARHGDPSQQKQVTNIIIAQGEVGTGTATAAGLQHFSNVVPSEASVTAEQPLAGVAPGAVDVVPFKIRDEHGNTADMDKLEQDISALLKRVIEDEHQIAILHMVHVSKTGYSGPRESFVTAMKQQYGDRLIVVVDAAHLRAKPEVIRGWLDSNFWVMVTGSKFAGGASFSGAVLIPNPDANLLSLNPADYPEGLKNYFTADDCDERFEVARLALSQHSNIGLALRWQTALDGLERFYALGSVQGDCVVAEWASAARSMIFESWSLELLEDLVTCSDHGSFLTCVGKCNSVISFGIRIADGADELRYMNTAELKKVYWLMTQDLNPYLSELAVCESGVAAQRCLSGQPVDIATDGPCTSVLRIALAAPEIIAALEEKHDPYVAARALAECTKLLVDKLDLIAEHWSQLQNVVS